MRNQLFAFLIVLIFSTSLNLTQCQHGQQLVSNREAEKLKTNERRASGLMAYPRIGRSDLATSNLNFNRRHDMEQEPDFQLYNSDFDSAPDKDYEDPRNLAPGFPGRSTNLKHTDKIPKEISWLIQDRLRSKDYRPWQKIDDARFPYSNSLLLTRGSRNSQVNGYTPRLGRENDVDRALCK
ncbi:CAPA peptides [Anthophora retusa]